MSLADLLILEPSAGEREWHKWRSEVDLESLDGDSLAAIPLLSGRLSAWSEKDPGKEKVLGICKRGWTQNQVSYRELSAAWTQLEREGVQPVAIAGCAAWALLYAEEKAVRPIRSLLILIQRDRAMAGGRALQSAGWMLEPDMPAPEGRILDEFEGLWFRSPAQTPLFLTWRLQKVSPEMALESETPPRCKEVDLHGAAISVLETEELLLDALTRNADAPVSWKCDAIVLLRNRRVDWPRLLRLAREPVAVHRLGLLRKEGIAAIPEIPAPKAPGRLRQRFNRLSVDYRQVAWARGETRSLPGFALYVMQRGTADPGNALTVIDASRHEGSPAAEYLRYKTLFLFLTARDIRLRYRKTWRGVLWALIQPLLPMLIFAAIFSRVIRPELRSGPYWLFVLAGLAPWNFFANAVHYSSVTFVNNFGLLNKVYFPRAILPAAAVSACLLDLLVSSCVLIALSWWNGYAPTPHYLLLPLVIPSGVAVAGVVGLAAASLNVLYRDLKPLVPFLIQVAMYATPVLYPLSMIPSPLRRLAWIDPMTGVVEAFRAALFGSSIDWPGEAISAVAFFVIAFCAALLFRKVEADLAERI